MIKYDFSPTIFASQLYMDSAILTDGLKGTQLLPCSIPVHAHLFLMRAMSHLGWQDSGIIQLALIRMTPV